MYSIQDYQDKDKFGKFWHTNKTMIFTNPLANAVRNHSDRCIWRGRLMTFQEYKSFKKRNMKTDWFPTTCPYPEQRELNRIMGPFQLQSDFCRIMPMETATSLTTILWCLTKLKSLVSRSLIREQLVRTILGTIDICSRRHWEQQYQP